MANVSSRSLCSVCGSIWHPPRSSLVLEWVCTLMLGGNKLGLVGRRKTTDKVETMSTANVARFFGRLCSCGSVPQDDAGDLANIRVKFEPLPASEEMQSAEHMRTSLTRALRLRGRSRNSEAWPEATAPHDTDISVAISERIGNEISALRTRVLKSRIGDGKKRRPAVANDFPDLLQRLKMIMLVAKVELRLESVNQNNGEGTYQLVDQQAAPLDHLSRSAAVLEIGRPKTDVSRVWQMKFTPGGRIRMDHYALMLQQLIAWRFFTPSDRFDGEGIPLRWQPTGADVQQVALESSMAALSFNFLNRHRV